MKSTRPSTSRRRRLFMGLCCLLWLVAGFVTAEIVLRLSIPLLMKFEQSKAQEAARESAVYEVAQQVAATGGGHLWERPGWEYRPLANFESTTGGQAMSIHINRHGFRGRDVEVPKPAGVLRMVCIGGSTTFDGLTDDHTYPALLEAKLRAMLDTDRIEVVNAGISVHDGT